MGAICSMSEVSRRAEPGRIDRTSDLRRPTYSGWKSAPPGPDETQTQIAHQFIVVSTIVRVLLDTNVWSRLADRREGASLNRLVTNTAAEVVVSPASLLEVLSGPPRQSRQARIRLMARNRWIRLPTEARVESEELIGEIRRLRPAWSRFAEPSLTYRNYERFWAQEVWERARREQFERPVHIRDAHRSDEDAITRTQRSMQREFRNSGEASSVEALAKWLTNVTALPETSDAEAAAEGWTLGVPSEPWRYETLGTLWRAINLQTGDNYGDRTYLDWLEPYVDVEQIRERRREFGQFLLYEVDSGRMVRNWLRWAVRFLQIAARIQLSNPRDEQLASYLPDADLFLTTDKTFFRILKTVAQTAPSPCATPHLLMPSSAEPIVDQIANALEQCGI